MVAGLAGAVERLVSLWDAVAAVADAEQAFVEHSVGSPKQPDLRSGTVVEMCRTTMEILCNRKVSLSVSSPGVQFDQAPYA